MKCIVYCQGKYGTHYFKGTIYNSFFGRTPHFTTDATEAKVFDSIADAKSTINEPDADCWKFQKVNQRGKHGNRKNIEISA